DAVLDLLGLLGDVNMNHLALRKRHDCGELLRRHYPQTMRSDADGCIGQLAHGASTRLHDARKALRSVDEAPLSRARLCPAEATVRVEHGQKSKTDAGVVSGGGYAVGQLTWIREGDAALMVMQIMKFPYVGESPLQHLRVNQRGDGLHPF